MYMNCLSFIFKFELSFGHHQTIVVVHLLSILYIMETKNSVVLTELYLFIYNDNKLDWNVTRYLSQMKECFDSK